MASWSTDEQLMSDLYPRLLAYAAVVGASHVDPDDLVHEALVAALRVRPLVELDFPKAYLRKAILSAAMRRQQRSGTLRRLEPQLMSADRHDPDYPSDLGDLEHLDPEDRALLYMVHIERATYLEAAAELGLSEQNARQRASRARKRLRTEIDAEETASRNEGQER